MTGAPRREGHATETVGAPAPPPPTALAGVSRWQRDFLLLAAGLALLIAWDVLGLDLPISRLFADGDGFLLRDQWFVAGVLHSGARWLAWAIALVLFVGIWKPLPFARRLTRRERVIWVAITIACALLIPLLKLLSLTSCPWSLTEFGGTATHVSHWLVGRADGGPGRCFPAGHATAAFCFLPGYFILRPVARVAARRWLWLTLAAGGVLTMVQVVRGAHYVSHSLWTGWCCWALTVLLLHASRSAAVSGKAEQGQR
jgi:membrane-associated PAP2 superfamily phosphatase